jgi:hypothetical protein
MSKEFGKMKTRRRGICRFQCLDGVIFVCVIGTLLNGISLGVFGRINNHASRVMENINVLAGGTILGSSIHASTLQVAELSAGRWSISTLSFWPISSYSNYTSSPRRSAELTSGLRIGLSK